jgi:hypothetical protein
MSDGDDVFCICRNECCVKQFILSVWLIIRNSFFYLKDTCSNKMLEVSNLRFIVIRKKVFFLWAREMLFMSPIRILSFCKKCFDNIAALCFFFYSWFTCERTKKFTYTKKLFITFEVNRLLQIFHKKKSWQAVVAKVWRKWVYANVYHLNMGTFENISQYAFTIKFWLLFHSQLTVSIFSSKVSQKITKKLINACLFCRNKNMKSKLFLNWNTQLFGVEIWNIF